MRVIIESPYGGNKKDYHRRYAQKCLYHSLMMDESPLAFHLLYTQVLDDDKTFDRKKGIELSHSWYKSADMVAAYIDFGVTEGMQEGIDKGLELGLPIQTRSIIYESGGHIGAGFRTYWDSTGSPTRRHVDKP